MPAETHWDFLACLRRWGFQVNDHATLCSSLDDVLAFPGEARRLWLRDVRHAAGLATGQTDTYALRVRSDGEPLEITLVFTDQPAALAAASGRSPTFITSRAAVRPMRPGPYGNGCRRRSSCPACW